MPGRLHGLDALRGFAALWVLVYHDTLRLPRFLRGQEMDAPLLPGAPWGPLRGMLLEDLGVMPVLWFFLISGFVIALTVERCAGQAQDGRGGGRWGGLDFVVRRASRIYPAYWVTVALTAGLIAAWPLPGLVVTPHQVLLNLTMVQSYLGVRDVAGVFWSLAVEVLFYGYALAALLCGRRHVHLVMLAWAAACLAAAVAERLGLGVSWQLSRLLLLRFGALLAGGMMLYRLWRGEHPWWSGVTLAVCALAVAVRFHPVSAASCVLAAGLIAWSTVRGPGWLAARPLAWLGAISYALYLSHEVLSYTIIVALDAAGVPYALCLATGMAAALLVATAITFGVERPAMAWVRGVWRG